MDEFTRSSGGFDGALRPKLGAQNYQRANEKSIVITCSTARTNVIVVWNGRSRWRNPRNSATPDVYSALGELVQGDIARLFSARQSYGIPLVVRSIKISGDAQQYFPRDSLREYKNLQLCQNAREMEKIRSFLLSKIIWIFHKPLIFVSEIL